MSEKVQSDKEQSANFHATATNILDLIKALLWPSVVLIGLCYFAGPIGKILQTVPEVLKNAQSIDYGSFKLSLSRTTLPKPNSEESAAIAKLDRTMLELVMSSGLNTRHCDPIPTTSPNTTEQQNRYDALVKIGLAEHVEGTICAGAGYIKLNELGNKVREFFITLIGAQFEKT